MASETWEGHCLLHLQVRAQVVTAGMFASWVSQLFVSNETGSTIQKGLRMSQSPAVHCGCLALKRACFLHRYYSNQSCYVNDYAVGHVRRYF